MLATVEQSNAVEDIGERDVTLIVVVVTCFGLSAFKLLPVMHVYNPCSGGRGFESSFLYFSKS